MKNKQPDLLAENRDKLYAENIKLKRQLEKMEDTLDGVRNERNALQASVDRWHRACELAEDEWRASTCRWVEAQA